MEPTPRSPRMQSEDALARRVQRLVASMLCVSVVPYAAFLLRQPPGAAVTLTLCMLGFGIAGVAASLWWAHRHGDHVVALEFICWPGFIAASVMTVAQGGVGGSAVWWLPLAPLVALQGGAMRSGIAMTTLLPVVLLAVQVLGARGLLPEPMALPPGALPHYLSVCLATLCICGLTVWSVLWRRRLLRTLDDALQAAQAAALAKGRFIATMSHELRTPLHGIVGASELLSASPLQEGQRQAVTVLQQSTHELGEMVEDVLDFSSLQAGRLTLRPSPTDLRALLRQSTTLVAAEARAKGLMLAWHCADNVPQRITCDGARVAQVLRHLTANAIKFTPSGEVHVTASVVEDDAADAGPPAWLAMSVRDTGIGIDDERVEVLFEPFTQADASTTRPFGGAGIGLAICRDLTRLLGGHIDVTSRIGAGSTFTLMLPLAEAPVAKEAHDMPERPAMRTSVPMAATSALTAPPEPAIADAPTDGPWRVLVVEDHLVNQLVAERMLELLGAEVTLAMDGADGIRWVAQAMRPFDLILMDCHMPVLDGFAAARRLREMEAQQRRPRVPIVAMTASSEDEVGAECRDAGMDGVLRKPVGIDQLRETLAQRCRRPAPSTGTKSA